MWNYIQCTYNVTRKHNGYVNIMWDCMNRENIAEHSMKIYMSAHTHTPHKHSMKHNMGVCEHSMGLYEQGKT